MVGTWGRKEEFGKQETGGDNLGVEGEDSGLYTEVRFIGEVHVSDMNVPYIWMESPAIVSNIEQRQT